MTFSTCCICGKEERDDLIPNWLMMGSKIVCDKCQERIIEKNR